MGTLFTLAFNYKIEHKNKIIECAFGDESLSGICIKELASNSGFKSSSISNSSSNSSSNSNYNSGPSSIPSSSPKPSPTYSFNNTNLRSSFANIKFDITNKVCNKCNVKKQITPFDKKKSIYIEYNSRKVNCEYCSSIISFSRLWSLIKKFP